MTRVEGHICSEHLHDLLALWIEGPSGGDAAADDAAEALAGQAGWAGKVNHIPPKPSTPRVIHSAIAIIIRFSVKEMKPNGTLLDPPTQAHFSSRLSI